MTYLWKYNTTGYWVMARVCNLDTAEHWLEVFRKEQPNIRFVLSRRRPKPPTT